MSDDIVARLHRFALRSNLRISVEAADEIERLRKENTDLRRAITEQNQLNRFTNITGQN